MKKAILVLLLFLTLIIPVHATSVTLTTANTSWTAPGGIYNNTILVEVWGGGGGGSNRSTNGGGGGGGGGAYSASYLYNVIQGTIFNVSMGNGGPSNTAGSDSYFNWTNNSMVVMAKGGSSPTSNNPLGANGGSATTSMGVTKYSGGPGGNSTSANDWGGAGGGGSAGTNGTGGAGGNGTSASGAGAGGNAGTDGGNGGAGRGGSSGNGNVGTVRGGGGGGAERFGAGDFIGGAGAAGGMRISWQDSGNVSVTFRYDQNETIVNITNITLSLISTAMSFNQTTTNGTLVITVLTPGNYTAYYGAPGFTSRQYAFEITNTSFVDLTLRMLSASIATNISVFVTDLDSKPLEGYVVKLMRYDINSNTYVLNQIFTSNSDGQGILSVELNTVLYEFIVEYNNQVVLTTPPSFIFGTTITLPVPISTFSTDHYFDSQNILGSITFNNATNVATFIYDDQDNIASSGCLYTYRTSNTTRTQYNTTCVSASSGSMTSPVFLVNGTGWYFLGKVVKGSNNFTVSTYSFSTGVTSPNGETTTKLAAFVMLIIMLLLAIMLKDNMRLLLLIVGSIPYWFMRTGFVALDPMFGLLFWIVCIIFMVVISI